jgi:hypothetical protein
MQKKRALNYNEIILSVVVYNRVEKKEEKAAKPRETQKKS